MKLTMAMLRKAKEMLLRDPVPDTCPRCNLQVSNAGIDILYVSVRGELGCHDCVMKLNYSAFSLEHK